MALTTCTLSRGRVTVDGLFLRTEKSRDRFLEILEQVRRKYRFVVVGYVVMPEYWVGGELSFLELVA